MLVLLSIVSIAIQAQQIIDSKIIGIDDGLKQREVYQIEREADGFFLIRMSDFLQLWDGRDFEDLDISVFESKLDLQDSKIVITNDSTTILLPHNNKQVYYPIDRFGKKLLQKKWLNKNYHSIIFDKGILYGTYHKEGNTLIETLNHQTGSADTLKAINGIHHIRHLSIVQSEILLQKKNDYIYTCNIAADILINHEIKGQIISSKQGLSLVSSDSIIYQYTNEGFQNIHEIDATNFTYKWADVDNYGNILLAHSDTKQYFKELTLITNEVEVKKYNSFLKNNNQLLDIYADNYNEKVLVGSYNNLTYYQFLHPSIQHTDKILGKAGNEFGKVISGATNDKDGNIYFVREHHGLFKHIPGADSSQQILKKNQASYFNRNLRIHYDSLRQQLWSTGYNKNYLSTIYRYDINSGTADQYEIDFNVNDFVFENKDNLILVGKEMLTNNIRESKSKARMGRFNLNTLAYEDINILPNPCQGISSVFIDGNYVFLGTIKNGLFITNRKMTQLIKIINQNTIGKSINLKSDYCYYTKKHKDKYVVSMLGDGIILLDSETLEPIKKITMANGLSSNSVASLLVDNTDNVWLPTFNGLNLLDENFDVKKIIQLRDGLSEREFNGNASIYVGEKLYLGTTNGVTIIDPKSFLTKRSSRIISIKDIEVHNESTGDIQRFIGNEKNIIVDDVKSAITIRPSISDFYTYKNDIGYTEIDIETNLNNYNISDNNIKFKNLNPGQYYISLNNRNNKSISTINMDIRNNYFKFWRSMLAMIFTIIGSYLASRYIIKKNKEREKEKTDYNKKISELRLNALKSHMNPHFIFNSLGAIQYFIQTQDTSKADEYLSKFAKLMRLILESSKSDYISIKDEMDLMELYVDLEYVRFEGLFDYKVQIDYNVDKEKVLPPMIVQPLVENAINHGLYNLKSKKGLLEILTNNISDDHIQITVSDNGVGRAFKSKTIKPHHKSRGMQILQERIDIINDKNEMKVELSIEDLMDEQKKSLGTKIIIDITY